MKYSVGVCAAILASLVFANTAYAGDCAPMPLLEHRAAVGVEMSHSTLGETGASALLGAHVVGPIEVGGAYQATRLTDVDRLQHEGRFELSAPVGFAGIDVCPMAGVGYARLTTDKAGTQGNVTTRDSRVGASASHSFEFPHGTHFTPFMQSMLVRRNVSWKSTDGTWRVSDRESSHVTEYWVGFSFATARSAFVTRFRPSHGAEPGEFGIGVVTVFGKR
jgi:hypothetical protein